jgi:hypothetical protein
VAELASLKVHIDRRRETDTRVVEGSEGDAPTTVVSAQAPPLPAFERTCRPKGEPAERPCARREHA